MTRSLAGSTGSRVALREPKLFFFPSPGLVAQDVELRRGGQDAKPIATVRRLRLTGSWSALLTLQHRLSRIEAEGLVVLLPNTIPPRDAAAPNGPQKTKVSSMIADGAVLETRGLRWQFERLRLENLGAGDVIKFDTVFQNPNPQSRITASGRLGPFNKTDSGNTPVSASFQLNGARLSQYDSLDGILNANGRVSGTLAKIHVQGGANVSDFEVSHNGHRVPVQGIYSAVVDGRNGDTTLDSVSAQVLETHLSIHGDVSHSGSQPGKTARLQFSSDKARIQDLLLLATKATPPALSGPMTLRAFVVLPPEKRPFLKRVRLDGSFRIDLATFSKATTQEKIEELSTRARGQETPSRVRSELSGGVNLRDGIAKLHDCRFSVPGAVALGGGTYNVISKVVDLSGMVAMEATVSEASTGFKSVLLKPFDALFRNRRRTTGAELPLRVTGRYPRPQFQVGLIGKKRRR